MADDSRRYHDEGPRRPERESSDRAGDEIRSWFGDDEPRARRYARDSTSYPGAAVGSYRADDREYHDRYRNERRLRAPTAGSTA